MKEINIPVGFLVVVSEPGGLHGPRYKGAYRILASGEEYPEEEEAMWDYVFSDVRDDETNLIPTLDKARQMYKRLSQSRRKFEIIFCCEGPQSEALDQLGDLRYERLGYDVAAVRGDCWSIVDDFCPSDWALPFADKLNAFGLFDKRCDAEEYLDEYITRDEADSDMPFCIVYLVRIPDTCGN